MPSPKWLEVGSYDVYYSNEAGEFIRWRYNDNRGELTIKRKTTHLNNNTRQEVNLKAVGNDTAAVEKFCELLGYKKDFQIYKVCWIAWVERVVLVYYIVYDKDMKESARYVEIEANEDLQWPSEEEAWNEVFKYEKLFEPLGINPKKRLKKSIYETFTTNKLKTPPSVTNP